MALCTLALEHFDEKTRTLLPPVPVQSAEKILTVSVILNDLDKL